MGVVDLLLSGCALGDDGLTLLVASLLECQYDVQLRTLNISNCGITDVGVLAVADLAAQQKALEALILNGNRFTHTGCVSLAYGLTLSEVSHLELADCGLTMLSMLALARNLPSFKLQVLNLSNNDLRDDGIMFLCRSLCGELAELPSRSHTKKDLAESRARVRKLHLSNCNMGALGARALAVAIVKGLAAEEIVLDANSMMGDEGAISIVLSLVPLEEGRMSKLKSLSLQNCGLSSKTLSLVTAVVRQCTMPKYKSKLKANQMWLALLDIRGNPGCASAQAVVLACMLHDTIPTAQLRLSPQVIKRSSASRDEVSPQAVLSALVSTIASTMSWIRGGGGVDNGRFRKEVAQAIVTNTWLDSCFSESTKALLHERPLREAFAEVSRWAHKLSKAETYVECYSWPAFTEAGFRTLEQDARARSMTSPMRSYSPTQVTTTTITPSTSRRRSFEIVAKPLAQPLPPSPPSEPVAASADRDTAAPHDAPSSSAHRVVADNTVKPHVSTAPSSNSLIPLSKELKVQLAEKDFQLINDIVNAFATNSKAATGPAVTAAAVEQSHAQASTGKDTPRKSVRFSPVHDSAAPAHSSHTISRQEEKISARDSHVSTSAGVARAPALIMEPTPASLPQNPTAKPQKLARKGRVTEDVHVRATAVQIERDYEPLEGLNSFAFSRTDRAGPQVEASHHSYTIAALASSSMPVAETHSTPQKVRASSVSATPPQQPAAQQHVAASSGYAAHAQQQQHRSAERRTPPYNTAGVRVSPAHQPHPVRAHEPVALPSLNDVIGQNMLDMPVLPTATLPTVHDIIIAANKGSPLGNGHSAATGGGFVSAGATTAGDIRDAVEAARRLLSRLTSPSYGKRSSVSEVDVQAEFHASQPVNILNGRGSDVHNVANTATISHHHSSVRIERHQRVHEVADVSQERPIMHLLAPTQAPQSSASAITTPALSASMLNISKAADREGQDSTTFSTMRRAGHIREHNTITTTAPHSRSSSVVSDRTLPRVARSKITSAVNGDTPLSTSTSYTHYGAEHANFSSQLIYGEPATPAPSSALPHSTAVQASITTTATTTTHSAVPTPAGVSSSQSNSQHIQPPSVGVVAPAVPPAAAAPERTQVISALYASLADLQKGLLSVAEKVNVLSPPHKQHATSVDTTLPAARYTPRHVPSSTASSREDGAAAAMQHPQREAVVALLAPQSTTTPSLSSTWGTADLSASLSSTTSSKRPSKVLRGHGLAPKLVSPEHVRPVDATVTVKNSSSNSGNGGGMKVRTAIATIMVQTTRRGAWHPFVLYVQATDGSQQPSLFFVNASNENECLLADEPIQNVCFHPLPPLSSLSAQAPKKYGLRVRGNLLREVLLQHTAHAELERSLEAAGIKVAHMDM